MSQRLHATSAASTSLSVLSCSFGFTLLQLQQAVLGSLARPGMLTRWQPSPKHRLQSPEQPLPRLMQIRTASRIPWCHSKQGTLTEGCYMPMGSWFHCVSFSKPLLLKWVQENTRKSKGWMKDRHGQCCSLALKSVKQRRSLCR